MKYWQAVREIYEIVPARDWKKEEKPMNKIVFIGNVLCYSQTMLFVNLFIFFSFYLFMYFSAGHNLNENILTDSLRTCAT